MCLRNKPELTLKRGHFSKAPGKCDFKKTSKNLNCKTTF